MGRPQRRCESNFHLSSPKIPLPHDCVNSLKPEVHLFSNRTIKKALLASCRQSCFPTISKSLKSLSVQPGPFPKGWVWLYLTAICLGNNLKSHGRHDTHVPSLSQGSRLALASNFWCFSQRTDEGGCIQNRKGLPKGCATPHSAVSSGNQGPAKCSESQGFISHPTQGRTNWDLLKPVGSPVENTLVGREGIFSLCFTMSDPYCNTGLVQFCPGFQGNQSFSIDL